MTDKQILDQIIEAYEDWQAEIGILPEEKDCFDMTDFEYVKMTQSYEKEITSLKNKFFELVSKAASGELRN